MDKNKLFCEKYFFLRLGVCASWKKFGQKIRNFEIFFDIIDNHTCVHMHIQKNFKIFCFLAKFLNFLEGPPIEFFRDRFFSTNIHGQTKFHWNFGCVLTFGLEPLSRELCISSAFLSSILDCGMSKKNKTPLFYPSQSLSEKWDE